MKTFDYALLGRVIRDFRNDDGRNQIDFSIDAEISTSFYGRLELGMHKISIEVLSKISLALNIPMSSIILEYESRKNDY